MLRPLPVLWALYAIAAGVRMPPGIVVQGPPQALSVKRVLRPGTIPRDVIVGRSRCRDVTWLLTDSFDLVEISTATTAVTPRRVHGFAAGDRPWGLACLDDGSVWALANPRTLVQLTGGRVSERIALALPRTALFGAGDRVLFQQLPVVATTAALMTSPPKDPAALRSWPGLVARRRPSRDEEVVDNLVNCGIGADETLPCWFIDERQIVASNGGTARTIDAGRLLPPATTAIHDVALTRHGLWILGRGTGADTGRLSGTSLNLVDEASGAHVALNLTPAARLLLAASETSCLLLTVDETIMEVAVDR